MAKSDQMVLDLPDNKSKEIQTYSFTKGLFRKMASMGKIFILSIDNNNIRVVCERSNFIISFITSYIDFKEELIKLQNSAGYIVDTKEGSFYYSKSVSSENPTFAKSNKETIEVNKRLKDWELKLGSIAKISTLLPVDNQSFLESISMGIFNEPLSMRWKSIPKNKDAEVYGIYFPIGADGYSFIISKKRVLENNYDGKLYLVDKHINSFQASKLSGCKAKKTKKNESWR